MATGIRIFIEYDFSNFKNCDEPLLPPFEDNISLWDLEHDAIDAHKDYRFFAALAGVRNHENGIQPLFLPRGLPVNCHDYAAEQLKYDEPPISWLTASELKAALAYSSLNVNDLSKAAQLIVETVNFLAKRCGEERVRILFAFT